MSVSVSPLELTLQVLLVAGGRITGFNTDISTSFTESFIPGHDDSWTSVSSLPEPVSYGSAVSLHNNIYLIGEIPSSRGSSW